MNSSVFQLLLVYHTIIPIITLLMFPIGHIAALFGLDEQMWHAFAF